VKNQRFLNLHLTENGRLTCVDFGVFAFGRKGFNSFKPGDIVEGLNADYKIVAVGDRIHTQGGGGANYILLKAEEIGS